MAEGQDIVNLGVGSPDLAPAEGVVDAVRRGAGEEDAFRYQPYRGIPALTAAMAGHLRRDFGVEVPVEGIVPLLGSKEACGFLSLAHLDPGDAALVPDPGYPTYTSAPACRRPPVPRLTELATTPSPRSRPSPPPGSSGPPRPAPSSTPPHADRRGAVPDRLTAVVASAKARASSSCTTTPTRASSTPVGRSAAVAPRRRRGGGAAFAQQGPPHTGARVGFAVGSPEAVALMFRIASQFASGTAPAPGRGRRGAHAQRRHRRRQRSHGPAAGRAL